MNKLPEPPPLVILRILALLVVGVMVVLALWFAKVHKIRKFIFTSKKPTN